jgi:hypothetical protein
MGIGVSRYWFRPRRYGYGATPSTWEGWVATAVFAAVVMALNAGIILSAQSNLRTTAVLIILVFAVIALFFWFAGTKTEGGWRWRWGRRR